MSSSNTRLAQQIAFINEIEKLKLVYRHNQTVDQSRFENSAEHSWHLALMAMVLAEHASTPALDIFAVVKMLLIHDLVEIYAGDTWLYDTAGAPGQAEREAQAAQKLFALLPADQAAEFHQLWDAFNARATPEAAFAAALDALQPLLNYLLSGSPEGPDGLLAEQDVLRRKQGIALGSRTLWELAQDVIAASTARGLYAAGPGES